MFMNDSVLNPKVDKYFQLAILLLVGLPHLLIVFSHQKIVLNWFNTDDAFYYFKTAQNIVEGHGVSFDGIARTNGFHPLWMVALLPIFTLAKTDLILPLRLVIALQAAWGLGSALLLYQLGKTLCSRWVAFLMALVWAFTPVIHEVVFKGGTEAGLNAFFLVLLLWQFYLLSEQLARGEINFSRIVAVGGIAALTLLSRLDNVFLVFILGGWLLLRFWRPPKAESVKNFATFQWWLKLGSAYFAPLVTTLGVYLLVNQIYFGSAMPVSGKVKRWWGTLKFTVYGNPPKNTRDFFEEFFSASDSTGPWSIVMSPLQQFSSWLSALDPGMQLFWSGVGLILLGLLIFLLLRNRKFVAAAFWRWNLIPLLAACLVQIVYYKAFGHIAQKGWYWVAEMLFIVLLLGLILEVLACEIQRFPSGYRLVAFSASLVAAIIFWPTAQTDYQVLTFSPSPDEHYYLQRAHFLEENTEPGSLIGMTGSGSSGYFVQDRTIVNLDGLINSMEYFIRLQNATADDYLASIGLDYVFGNAYILQNTNPYQWNFDNRLDEFRDFEVDDEKTLVLFRFH
jgi:hypothetical protein